MVEKKYVISEEELKALYAPGGVVKPELLSFAFDILKSKMPVELVVEGKVSSTTDREAQTVLYTDEYNWKPDWNIIDLEKYYGKSIKIYIEEGK